MVFPLLIGVAVVALAALFAGAQLFEGLKYTFLHVIFLVLGGIAFWWWVQGVLNRKTSLESLLIVGAVAVVLILLGVPNLLFSNVGMPAYSIVQP